MSAPFLPQEIIRKKRDAAALSVEDIQQFIFGIKEGAVTEAHLGAFAMATYLNGMNNDEVVALTSAMRDSGDVLDWDHLDGPVVDKHSTGGIGDNVSLMLAPIVAACGAYVPMISGRGLGHTGGTLDKLEAIPGYNATPDLERFRQTVKDVGCAIVGANADIAPADKALYAVRDVTATVDSNPLITASILSKKLASGLKGLVLDVKMGNGAFSSSDQAAITLARLLTKVSNEAGLPSAAIVTDMNEPLSHNIGNALEVKTALTFLTNTNRNMRLYDVVASLAANMLLLAGIADSRDGAKAAVAMALVSGKAAEVFGKMISALGGPADFVENASKHLPQAAFTKEITAPTTGYVRHVDSRLLGMGVVALGGGRTRADQVINPAVGFSDVLPTGTKVSAGDPLLQVHADREDQQQPVTELVAKAIIIEQEPPTTRDVIVERIGAV